MAPPRQIYASAASRGSGRRWTSRRRSPRRSSWVSAGLLAALAAGAALASELLRVA
jgi:hypothetical protein